MFAAYSQHKQDEETDNKPPERSWLQNDSFQLDPSTFSKESSASDHQVSSGDDQHEKKLKEKKKHKEKKKKKKKESSRSTKEDKKRQRSPVTTIKIQKSETLPLIPKGTVFSNGLRLKPHQAFYEDCTGDRNNLSFPNLYFKYVAK